MGLGGQRKHANETARQMIEHYGWNAFLSYAEIKEFLSHAQGVKQKTTERVRKVYCCLREQLGREPQKESEAELSEMADASRERTIAGHCLFLLHSRGDDKDVTLSLIHI